MHNWLIAMAAVSVLAACNRAENAVQQLPPNMTSWASVEEAALRVPEGVAYAVSTHEGLAVAEISGIPEEAVPTGWTGGVSVRLPDAIEAQASGAQIRVTVRAASAQDGAQFGVAYSTSEVGNSGWQKFPLTATPSDYSFEWDVPVMQAGNGDYLGFRDYSGAGVRIVGFSVEIIAASPAPTADDTP